MTEHKFTVIKGGADKIALRKNNRRFVSAFVTDTRLMGVVGLHIHWEIPTGNSFQDLDQFFYYDAEEYGLETYTGLWDADADTLDLTEETIMGGLGGTNVDLCEWEALFLVQTFAAESKRLHAVFPEPFSEYEFLLREPLNLTEEAKKKAFAKMCTPIHSNYELIHYFIMRCLGKDPEGAAVLTAPGVSADFIGFPAPATLCKNSINEHVDKNGVFSYLCEALAEPDDAYYLMVLELTVKKQVITSAEVRSSFQVTAAEAAMMLNRPEYVTVYEILADPDTFDSLFLPTTPGMLQTSHCNGRLFLEFNKDNTHVNRPVFRLNEDVHGLFFISDFGQFIAAAYSLPEIHEMETTVRKGPLGKLTLPVSRFEFKEPILYEFIESDYDDFSEFLESLQPEDGE